MWKSQFLRTPKILVIAAPTLLPLLSFAQQPGSQPVSDQPVTTLHVQAREVLLPVTVRDKHGALVTNLQKSDFTLTEDGRPQVIKSFSREANLPFQMGLLVDTSHSVIGAMDDERKAADKFVDQMLAGDAKSATDPANAKPPSAAAPAPPAGSAAANQAFLIHFDREVELLQDFTASRDKLHHEIDDMGPTSRSGSDSQGPETTGDERGSQRGGRAGTQLYDAIFLASDELMKPKDGRKALLVFSDGVDHGSKESISEALDAAEHANVSIYTIYFKGEEERTNSGFPGGRRGGMGGGWPGGGGGGYPGGGGGYPGGGGGGGRGSQPQVDGRKIMDKIATQTGGRYFDTKKKQDLEEIYGIIADELHGQYLLTYTPDKEDNDGAYHKIVLKANNGDLTVMTREGYYAPGGDSK
jgi:VWFA-related protein